MTLEVFNLLLAAGGGVVVPGGVGAFAVWRVHKQDKPWRTALTTRPELELGPGEAEMTPRQKEAHDENRVPA